MATYYSPVAWPRRAFGFSRGAAPSGTGGATGGSGGGTIVAYGGRPFAPRAFPGRAFPTRAYGGQLTITVTPGSGLGRTAFLQFKLQVNGADYVAGQSRLLTDSDNFLRVTNIVDLRTGNGVMTATVTFTVLDNAGTVLRAAQDAEFDGDVWDGGVGPEVGATSGQPVTVRILITTVDGRVRRSDVPLTFAGM
jgi:hypothetical protein